jgi:hypothetical protein
MMATVHHVTSSSVLRKFQAAWFLLNRVYIHTAVGLMVCDLYCSWSGCHVLGFCSSLNLLYKCYVSLECLTMQNHAMLHSFIKLGIQYLFRSFLSLLAGWFLLNTALFLYLRLNVIGSSVQRNASPYLNNWRLRVIFWQNTRKKCSGTGNMTSLSSTIAPSSLYRKTPLYLRVPKTRE